MIIAPSKKGIDKVKDFLDSKGCEVSVATMADGLHQLSLSIKSVENFFLCDSHLLAEDKEFLFCFGMIADRGKTVFINGENTDYLETLVPASDSTFYGSHACDSLEILKDRFQEFFDADKKRNSLSKLLSMGLPFNADCMVHFIEKDKPEIVQLVFDAGLDVNSFTEDGVPVLCAATRADNVGYVKWLMEKGANVNIISKDRGYSPVMDAVWKKNLEMVKLFINEGADLNVMSSDGQPILVLAVGNGSAKIVEELLHAGADPDVKDSMGMSARGYANLFKNADLVKILEKYPSKE